MTRIAATVGAIGQVCPDSRLIGFLEQLAAATILTELPAIVARCLDGIVTIDCLDILLHDASTQTMKRYAPTGLLHFQTEAEVSADRSAAGYVWETQVTVCTASELPAKYAGAVRHLHRGGIHSFALLPLATPRVRLGALALGSARRRLSSEQIGWVEKVLCGHLASAVDRILALENRDQLLMERDRARVMFAVTQALVKPCELSELFVEVATILRPFMQPDYVGLALNERDSSQIRLSVMDFPEGKGVIREERLIAGSPSHSGTPAAPFGSGSPLLIQSLAETTVPFEVSQLLLAEGLNSACFIPLAGTTGSPGTLGFGSLRANAFSQYQVDALSELAPSIGAAIENATAFQRTARLRGNPYFGRPVRAGGRGSQARAIIGSETGLRDVLQTIGKVASTGATVLLLGETGTGKELLARSVHDLSDRKARNFITMNCTAIPAGLLESELFGHEKGAFTGAVAARPGRFELANHGTLFLDEVGDIPLELQPKLLRVLQESEFERLGGTRTLRVDVRIVAATNRDLVRMTRDGRFRSDLFYRLNVIPVRVPALRERSIDIPRLVSHFMAKYSDRFGRHVNAVAPAALEKLRHWHWPGNVRELENLIERAVVLSSGPLLDLPPGELMDPDLESDGNLLKSAENELIRRTLHETNGVIGGPNGAAARLGMKRSTLQSRLKKLTQGTVSESSKRQ